MSRLRESLVSRNRPLGTWISIGHPTVAEVSASIGLDFLLVDLEHTTMSLETVEDITRAVEAVDGDTETVVRVPSNDPVRIKRVLDIGVDGIMVPMLESADEARRVATAVTYPPEGERGVASGRAAEYGQSFVEYVREADENLTVIGQIESRDGVANADEIAHVDGIDALFVGPADLSMDYGVFGEPESEEFVEALRHVVAAGRAAETPVGTLTVDPDDMRHRLDQGFDYLIVGKDTSHLATGNEDAKARYERLCERSEN
ncbi:2,4-dihydroxyhept-2-ene-1,7-dioic acid aldolase [Halarchaeum acidiphilum MH1-52-1]|uniref:2,4-dihydroxyhept-2-ene-1,7-dioic acid aldolase n=1 Tax=Halarchaeum acidiphilum MH1-52-1 TaxID=1261545 RepID=U3A4E1_9EURY|nr:aldolase/citrate lyase family protein [Halarchaeum acidiphilum]GAD52509.1 2,4-dihydroxyhept-2-ene-1,7-dioic acid aldolase [Halarchaeum acidiphilum MH1-52-1]